MRLTASDSFRVQSNCGGYGFLYGSQNRLLSYFLRAAESIKKALLGRKARASVHEQANGAISGLGRSAVAGRGQKLKKEQNQPKTAT